LSECQSIYKSHNTMSSIGPRTIKQINEAIDFVETNIKNQYVIPHCAFGLFDDNHYEIDGLISHLKCKIAFRNLKYEVKFHNYGVTLDDIAKIIIEDEITSDADDYITHDPLTGNRLPPIMMFKIDYTHTINRVVDINGEPFEIAVTFERKYTKRE